MAENIIVALIGVAGVLFTGLITLIISLRREKKDTEAILKQLEGIGGDTKGVPQKADNIKEDTSEIRRNVAPTADIADGVKSLVADLNYRKGVRSESSFRTQDALKAGMDAVFEENARLNKTIREQAEEIGNLKAKAQELEAKNRNLEKQLSNYKKQERTRSDIDREER